MRSTYGKQLKHGYAVMNMQDNLKYLLYASQPIIYSSECFKIRVQAGDELLEWAAGVLGCPREHISRCRWGGEHILGVWGDIAIQLERQ